LKVKVTQLELNCFFEQVKQYIFLSFLTFVMDTAAQNLKGSTYAAKW